MPWWPLLPGIETQLPPHHNTKYFTFAIHTHHPSPRHLVSLTSIDGLQITDDTPSNPTTALLASPRRLLHINRQQIVHATIYTSKIWKQQQQHAIFIRWRGMWIWTSMMATQQIVPLHPQHTHRVIIHRWNFISRAIAEQFNNQPYGRNIVFILLRHTASDSTAGHLCLCMRRGKAKGINCDNKYC
jgi:hypothetical protein